MLLAATWTVRPSAARIWVVVLGAILALAFGVSGALSAKWTAMALGGTLLMLLAFCKLEAAIVVYALSAFLQVGPFFAVSSRTGYAEGLYPSELMLGALVFVWGLRLIVQLIREKSIHLSRTPINLPLVVLVGSAAFSFIAAQFMWDYRISGDHKYYITQITEIGLLCMPIGVCLLITNCVNTARWAKAVYWSMLLVGIVGFWSDCPWVKTPDFLNLRWTGLLVVPLISFLYAYVIVNRQFGWKELAALCALGVLMAVQFAYMSWVAMWLSASVSLCVISWFRSKKLFAALFCIVLLICVLKLDALTQMLEAEQAERSLERFDIWASALKMALASPIWGIGPDNFYPYYSHYYAGVFQTFNVTSPHSNWLQMLVQYGFVGFAAFVWFVVACFFMLSRLYRRATGASERTILLAITGTFAGMALISCFGDYLFPARANGGLTTFCITVYTWIQIGVACSLGRLIASREEDADAASTRELAVRHS